MNHKDLTKAFFVIMAAAIIASLGTVSNLNTNTDEESLNTNSIFSSPANISLEDVEAVLLLKH